MGDSKKDTNNQSLLSFLLLPQFSQMFRSSSHIIPIFMRAVANLLVQSSLLPPTHPGVLYGTPGAPKTSLVSMLGDAWYTLRSTRASAYQWSVFCSILLLIFFTVSSGIMTIFNVSSTFIGSAAAQVFSSTLGPTDIASIPGATCGIANFDKNVPPLGSAHGDYAIMFLDKILREGANGTGCKMQNATQALMQVYNSGMMVIASIMLFWLIISVVVDIARTGQVGGGRHNLVWAPIRIVFALALMIPLGATGFSTGQFMIMKVAEYGSNFGTNAWLAYYNAEVTQPYYKLPEQENLTGLAGEFVRSWVCIVAHNGYSYQAEGSSLPGDQIVQRYADVGTPDKGMQSYSYRKMTSDNVCGRISYPTQNDPVLQAEAASTDPVEANKAKFQLAMNVVWENMFSTTVGAQPLTPTPPNGGPVNQPQTTIDSIANKFACGFVAQHIWGTVTPPGNDALSVNCGNSPAPQCGSGPPASGKYPDMSCISGGGNSIVDYMHSTVLNGAIAAYAATFGNPSQNLQNRGWAGMGIFYRQLSEANNFILNESKVPVVFHAGALPDEDGLGGKVDEVVNKFDIWWQTVPMGTPNPGLPAAFQRNVNTGGNNPGIKEHSSGILGGIGHFFGGVWGAITGGISEIMKLFHLFADIFKKIGEFAKSFSDFVVNTIGGAIHGDILKLVVPDAQDKDVYPLSMLAKLGNILIGIGIGIHIGILTIVVLLACIPMFDASAGIASATAVTLLGIFGSIFLSCGAILSYWLPCLPFIRVTHAVLTWAMVVFEAVALVPVAALSFLSTTGEGWDAKHVFLGWLDVLVRPVLTVIGYVGSLLLFNTFFIYFYDGYKTLLHADVGKITDFTSILLNILGAGIYAVIFVMVIYTAANTCFKLINGIPDAFFRWAPLGQQRSSFGEDGGDHSGAVSKAGNMAHEILGAGTGALAKSIRGRERDRGKDKDEDNDGKPPGAKDGG